MEGLDRRMGCNRRTPPSFTSVRLIDFSGGTFTRASNGTYHTGQSTMNVVGVNVKRFPATYGDRSDMVLCEGARTHLASRSEEFDNAAWVKTNCTITADSEVAPDGTTTGDVLTTTASGIAATCVFTSVVSNSLWFAVYVRRKTTTQVCSITASNGGTTSNLDFTPGVDWSKYLVARNAAGAANIMTIRPHATAGTGTAGDDMSIWGADSMTLVLQASYLKTQAANVICQADTFTYAAGTWDTRLATGKSTFYVSPTNDSADISQATTYFSFGGSNDDIRMSNTDRVTVVAGGATMVQGNVLTWSKHSLIRIYVDPSAGMLRVSGATTGNGTTIGTPWSWPTGVALRVGGIYGGAAEAYARISEPYTW